MHLVLIRSEKKLRSRCDFSIFSFVCVSRHTSNKRKWSHTTLIDKSIILRLKTKLRIQQKNVKKKLKRKNNKKTTKKNI